MVKWWEENGPPVYVSVAAYLGMIKTRPKKGSSGTKSGGGDLNELAAMFKSSGGMIQ